MTEGRTAHHGNASLCNRVNWELPVIVTTFPRTVRVIEHTLIPLKDGTMLAARIWLPDDAEQNPVPAILEYLPYRKRDGTYERDALTHPYLAGHGYAGVRIDIRGCGESDGLAVRRVRKARARRWRGGDCVVGGATLVQRRCRDDGNLLGWVQWTSDCGAPPSGTQGDRNHLLDRRSLRRRCALHGRHASCGRGLEWGFVLFRLDVPAARPGACRR